MIERGRKNRTNIKKQVVRNPAMLAQTMRRRILFTGGSGTDSTTAPGFIADLAGTLAAGGATAPGGALDPVVACSLGVLSKPKTSVSEMHFDLRKYLTTNHPGMPPNHKNPRNTGIPLCDWKRNTLIHQECGAPKIVIISFGRQLLYIGQRVFCKKIVLPAVHPLEQTMKSKSRIILYTKPGCHLCEEMKHEMVRAQCDDLYTLEEVNIETDPDLLRRYRFEIPVLEIGGVVAFKARLRAEEFKAYLVKSAASC